MNAICARVHARAYTRIYAGVLLATLLMSFPAFAQTESSSYRLDYGRTVSDAGQKNSLSYNLIGAMTELEADGGSNNYNLRNVYGGSFCGNGFINAGEQCDSGNFGGLTCADFGYNNGYLICTNCQISTANCFDEYPTSVSYICGNGLLEAGEQCDDGNLENGDGCSSGCRIEEWRCGNGIREGTEECDDGNVNYDDGCTPECKLEPIMPPICGNGELEEGEECDDGNTISGDGCSDICEIEIPPEELEFLPEIGEIVPLEIPKPIPPVPLRPVAPPLKPVAPPENYPYHFERYKFGEEITVLDEDPFIVTDLAPNTYYELVIYDPDGRILERQGVQADPNGILKVETIPYLDYTTYTLDILNTGHELEIRYNITIEDRRYRLHDAITLNKERFYETIYLGAFKRDEKYQLSGRGKENNVYYAYYQSLKQPKKGQVNPITVVRVIADSEENFVIPIPEHINLGAYHIDIVQIYEDGKVSRNKRYIIEFAEDGQIPCIWVLVIIMLMAIIGQINRNISSGKRWGHRKNGSIFRIQMLSAVLAILMVSNSIAYAVRTTPIPFIYEGKLLDNIDDPIGTMHVFRFSLWSSRDFTAADLDAFGGINTGSANYGGWWEAQAVVPNIDGTFSVELGNVNPMPDMDFTIHKFLQVDIKKAGDPDTLYELMDPTGDSGADANDRQTIGSSPFTNNADFIDNAEIGTSAGDIAILDVGGVWNIDLIPGGTNFDTFILDDDDTAGLGNDIELQFGNTLDETLLFDITNDWFEFSNDLSMNQFEIKDFAIDNLPSAPVAPVTGQIYYNTSNNNTYIWNGTSWGNITAIGGDDLDSVYDSDADKVMDVDNASGLEFESTVTGDIIFDLASTGDLVVQDNGNPFAIFTDTGEVGIGTVAPASIFHIDTNAVNTTPILTLENTGGDLQFFRSDATPEGSITGSIGDFVIDGTNGAAYIKNTGNATNTGWLQFGGSRTKQEVFNAEYEDAVAEPDGTSNKGILTSDAVDNGGTNKYNYYEWNTTRNTLQDIDVVFSVKLPLDFLGFAATPLKVLFQTSDANPAQNKVDVALYDTTGTAVTLTGANNLANASWTTANILFGGSPTFTAGGTITLRLKLSTDKNGFARIADVVFDYSGQ